ncbi:MAG TPA: tetratricopeptide repeat protein [Planktothrix sp.]|jgi:tetratricopeptide (TPR) repeat protein
MNWDELNEASQKAYSDGQYLQAEKLLDQALKAADNDARQQASTLFRLGKVYLHLADNARAEAVLTRALSLCGKALGLEHVEVARVLDQMGTAYTNQHKFAEGESLLNRGLEMRKKMLDADHPEIAESLVSLGALNSAQKNYSKAEQFLRDALAIQEKIGDELAAPLSPTLGLLAVLYLRQNNLSEAERFATRAVQIREATLGPHHPDVAMSLHILAMIAVAAKRYDDALALYMRVLNIRQNLLPREHPLITSVVRAIGLIYMRKNQFAEAQSVFEDLERLTEGGGSDEDNHFAMVQLSWLYILQRKFDTGQVYIDRSLRKLLPSDKESERIREKLTISLLCCQVGNKDYVGAAKTLPAASRVLSKNRNADKLLLKQGLQKGLYAGKRR